MSKTLFLDANAHMPVHPDAIKLYSDYNITDIGFGHPSSPNFIGRKAEKLLEESRDKIATLLGAESKDSIIFTSTCTQACEWAIELIKEKKIACSPIEHPAVRDPISQIGGVQYLEISSNGNVLLPANNEPEVIVCIHTHNELGIIQDLSKFKNFIICSDVSQSIGKIPFSLKGIDIAMIGAHKFMGMPGVGILYLKDLSLYKEFGTGSRHFIDRPGTPDTLSIVATAKALEIAISTLENRTNNMKLFQTTIENGLEERGFKIIGKDLPRSPNTTFVKVYKNAREILSKLSENNIYVGLGSACSSIYSDISPTIKAIGEPGNIDSFLRISQWGQYNNKDAEYFLKIFDKIR